ncbi:MAG TPA: polyhydroxyalkanoate synthesis regulator DNA-binding domain-containing protein [Verrucomicrobiae bacterium]|jgi:polyhydroxyalkanoate synthesis repressor PhaR|nr:polyhydroxyalkanoate synthesis regulator DNA-binding domain-containing protein [Verrucomicrobiae bacterium]
MDSDRIVVKKYANRRLYDTSNSRYINLEDIAALVRNGKDVQVLDASTGEDITRVTLTQIIVEDAKDQPSGLPLELLRQLIQASDRVGQEFIMWYLKSAFDAYSKVQSSLQTRLSEMQSAALSPIQMVKSFLQTPAAEKGDDNAEELAELRRRLAELEAQKTRVRKRPAKKTAAKKRRT